jgi:hypothetical protein
MILDIDEFVPKADIDPLSNPAVLSRKAPAKTERAMRLGMLRGHLEGAAAELWRRWKN